MERLLYPSVPEPGHEPGLPPPPPAQELPALSLVVAVSLQGPRWCCAAVVLEGVRAFISPLDLPTLLVDATPVSLLTLSLGHSFFLFGSFL